MQILYFNDNLGIRIGNRVETRIRSVIDWMDLRLRKNWLSGVPFQKPIHDICVHQLKTYGYL